MVVKIFFRNIKLIWNYFILNLKKEWKYKASFFMQIIMMLLNDFFFILQWYIIFKLVDNIGGYRFNETMLLWAISAGGFGVAHMFFEGAWKIKDYVYDGKLDVFLTQPKNVLINVCASSTDISAIGDFLYSFIVLAIIKAPWWWYLIIPIVSILAGVLIVAVYVTYITLCFWVKNGYALGYTSKSILEKTNQYPSAIYNLATKIFLFTLVPTFFYTFIPAQYFFLTPNIWWMLACFAVTTVWGFLAFFFFNLGLKKYNSGNLMGGRL